MYADDQEGRYKAIWKREFKTPMAHGRSTEIITMIMWIQTRRLSIKELSLYADEIARRLTGYQLGPRECPTLIVVVGF